MSTDPQTRINLLVDLTNDVKALKSCSLFSLGRFPSFLACSGALTVLETRLHTAESELKIERGIERVFRSCLLVAPSR